MSRAKKQVWKRRDYQVAALAATRKVRALVLFWTRQGRKSTTLGDIAFDRMSMESGQDVIAASASLLTGSELVTKALTTAEMASLVAREARAVAATMGQSAEAGGLNLVCANSETQKVYRELKMQDFAELYQSSKLEMRLYFDKTNYSRMLVIAPNPATARGWSGTVIRDEAGFTHPNLESDLQVAVKPIIDTDPEFKIIYASNLPRNDRHPYFEMTLPPDPTMTFDPQARGHFYRGQTGMLVHRVSLADAYAAGHVLYDMHSGKALTYAEFLADPANRMGLDESYRLIHKSGGSAAVNLFALMTAQERGARECAFYFIDGEAEFQLALGALRALIGGGRVGVGYDVATTTGDVSNPSSVTITEQRGSERSQRLVVAWKEREPDVAIARVRQIVEAVRDRPEGGGPVGLAIDASSELYFARMVANALRMLCPVKQVSSGAAVDPAPPGYVKVPNYKTYLGDVYSAGINDNLYAMPSDKYLQDDHRLVTKSGGTYACEVQADGKHGDTFDSGKLAELVLSGSGGPFSASAVAVDRNRGMDTVRGVGWGRRRGALMH